MSVVDSYRPARRAAAGKLWRAVESLEKRALLAAHRHGVARPRALRVRRDSGVPVVTGGADERGNRSVEGRARMNASAPREGSAGSP